MSIHIHPFDLQGQATTYNPDQRTNEMQKQLTAAEAQE